jgi:hypothetical protein
MSEVTQTEGRYLSRGFVCHVCSGMCGDSIIPVSLDGNPDLYHCSMACVAEAISTRQASKGELAVSVLFRCQDSE